jgi:phosphatidylserine/phosphatidylglycerophosphate/cardiolipin synthase-like enzyme
MMSKQVRKPRHYSFPWRDGNRFDILIDGSSFLPEMLKAIKAARQYVLLEMYLVESGSVVDRFIAALRQAAENGVKVCLLLDDFGTIGLEKADRRRLEHDNIRIVYFNKLRSYNTIYNMFRVFLLKKKHHLYRNHRKLLLVDGDLAFVGGTGLVDEFDPPHHPQRRWRETMVKIQGPVVVDWQQLFTETWNKNTAQALLLPAAKPDVQREAQRGRVTVNDIDRHSEVMHSLVHYLNRARDRVWFATAYFVPTWRVRRSLKQAARSGVDVRLLLPGPVTDHPAVRHISHRLYGRLLKNGIRIFEYQPRFFHAKCIMCDHWVSIGSSNFDRWNLRWNLEANQEIQDKTLAKQVEAMFAEDFSNSVEYSYEQWYRTSWYRRLQQWFWKKVETFSQTIGR